MTIQCGDRALEDYRKKQEGVTAVSVALSAPPEKVGDAVLHMKEQMDQIRMKLNQMQASYLAGKLEEIKADDKFVCLFEEELDNIAVRNFVNDACECCQGICAAFIGTDEDGYRYIIEAVPPMSESLRKNLMRHSAEKAAESRRWYRDP